MLKNYLRILFIAPLLMAFQCEDEIESTLVFNNYKVNITPQTPFSTNDTIWIMGITSSKAYDLEINDSIFSERFAGDVFSIMKFIQPTQTSNCIDAIDNFELINVIGGITFLPVCENAQITAHPEITFDSLSYRYKIGLKPLNQGDFVVSWQDSKINNSDRNEYIIDNYPIDNFPNQIGFNKCGNVSWRYLNESEREFYFIVE